MAGLFDRDRNRARVEKPPAAAATRSDRQHAHQACAIAHPNIALVKYWGKASGNGNVPAVPSLSITLDALSTTTTVSFDPALTQDQVSLNGTRLEADSHEARRVSSCLDRVRERADCRWCAWVDSSNDFPTGAGLASSASGFAALVLAAAAALDRPLTAGAASAIARRASASAARSLFGGFVQLAAGNADDDPQAEPLLNAADWPLEVVVAVCTDAPKAVGSSAGMRASAATSPFYRTWLADAGNDLEVARGALEARDFAALARISEASCLKMHAVMLSTEPALIYWNAATLATLERIRHLQAEGVPVFFTTDAGPQVKAICAPGWGSHVAAALETVDGVHRVLRSALGSGARICT